MAHDEPGKPSVDATSFDGPGKAVQQVKVTCDFEDEMTWAVGVSGQKPFRVETAAAPPRLVVDLSWD